MRAVEHPLAKPKIEHQRNVERWRDNPGEQFIFNAARELAARGTDPEYKAFAERVVALYEGEQATDPMVEVDAETSGPTREQCLELMDTELTLELSRKLHAHTSDSPLAALREKLGITAADQEKIFDVVVVRPQNFPQSAFDQLEAWSDFLGHGGMMMFRDKLKPNETPLIILGPHQAADLIQPGKFDTSSRMLGHEYVHTQREFTYRTDKLFHWVDEVCVDYEPRAGSYGKETVVLGILAASTPDLRLRRDLIEPFNAGDEAAKASFLEKFTEHFGVTGMLLLGAAPIRDLYQPDFPLPLADKPGLLNEPTRIFETFLALRARKDPNWLQYIETWLQETPMATIEAQFGYHASAYTQLEPGTESDTHVGQLLALKDRILAEKKALGEKGFYDK